MMIENENRLSLLNVHKQAFSPKKIMHKIDKRFVPFLFDRIFESHNVSVLKLSVMSS